MLLWSVVRTLKPSPAAHLQTTRHGLFHASRLLHMSAQPKQAHNKRGTLRSGKLLPRHQMQVNT